MTEEVRGVALTEVPILFESKLLMPGAIDLAFEDSLVFIGPFHGVVAFSVFVATIVVLHMMVAGLFVSNRRACKYSCHILKQFSS